MIMKKKEAKFKQVNILMLCTEVWRLDGILKCNVTLKTGITVITGITGITVITEITGITC